MKFSYKISWLIILLISQVSFLSCNKEHQASPDPKDNQSDTVRQFSNPILKGGLNPYVTQHNGEYYFMLGDKNYINIAKVDDMIYMSNAYRKTIYFSDPNSKDDLVAHSSANITSPEMYKFDGKWYIYFAADKDGSFGQKRIFVIENSSEDPLLGTWQLKAKLAVDGKDFFAKDPTVLEHNNERFLVWSGWEEEMPADPNLIVENLYIAKLGTPTSLTGTRTLISEPKEDWEKYSVVVAGVSNTHFRNQNPEVLKNAAGKVFLTFTASGCENDNSGLGLLTLADGAEPMSASSWSKSTNSVFASDDLSAFGPGFNGFFKSHDTKEDWLIYSANKFPGEGCGDSKSIRIQKFTWNANGEPEFGNPVLLTDVLDRPSRATY